jgi:hypothetical protein
MSSNEFRVKCGLKPSDQEGADELRNKNINQANAQLEQVEADTMAAEDAVTLAENEDGTLSEEALADIEKILEKADSG